MLPIASLPSRVLGELSLTRAAIRSPVVKTIDSDVPASAGNVPATSRRSQLPIAPLISLGHDRPGRDHSELVGTVFFTGHPARLIVGGPAVGIMGWKNPQPSRAVW